MGGKSKAQTIGYHYKWAMHMAWCRAADALLEIRAGGATAWEGRVTANTVLSIDKPELWGGEKGQGGIVSDFEVLFGGETQAPSSYLASTFGAKQSGNRGIVSTILKGGRYGAFVANPKPLAAKFERIHADGMGWYPETAAVPLESDGASGMGVAYDDQWSYRVEEPGSLADYSGKDFDHSGWAIGAGGFGTEFVGANVGTHVDAGLGRAIWLRRTVVGLTTPVSIVVKHDDSVEIWWNGALVVSNPAYGGEAFTIPLASVTGNDTLAVKVVDSAGGGNIFASASMAWTAPLAQLVGMNGAHMIYEAIAHKEMTGDPVGLINDASFRAAAATLYGEGLGLCTTYDSSQETPEQFIQRVCNAIGAACSQSRIDGQYYLDLMRNDYDVEALPLITDDDIIEFKATPVVAGETINAACVEWTDPTTGDTRTTSPVVALGRATDAGETITETRRYLEIPTEALALRLAQRDVDAAKPTLTRYELTVKRKHRALREGQAFRVQLPTRGLADAVLRLGSIRHGTHADGRVRITALQDVFELPTTVTVQPSPGDWVAPSKVPVAPPAQTVIEAPYVELVAAMSTADLNALASDAGFLLTVAALPSPGLNYAIASAAGAEDYVERGTADFCPTALVVEAASLLGPLSTVFSLSDGSLLDRVEVGSWGLWGSEIVRIDAIDASLGTCTLARACGDTVPAAHAAGERIWFCGDWVGSDAREYVDGELVKAKLLTRTTSGQLALENGVESQVTIDQRQARPYPPGLLRITDASTGSMAYPANASGALTVTWAHRDRLLQADQLIAEDAASIGPEIGTTYTVRYYLDGVLDATEAGIAGTSATPITLSANGTARVEVEAVRDGLTSWQAANAEFAYLTTPPDVRVTDAADTRITDSGARRITE